MWAGWGEGQLPFARWPSRILAPARASVSRSRVGVVSRRGPGCGWSHHLEPLGDIGDDPLDLLATQELLGIYRVASAHGVVDFPLLLSLLLSPW